MKFVGRNDAEKTAGVWVDGQYVGAVKDLNGSKKITLLPGKHDILIRQAWYWIVRNHIEHSRTTPQKLHKLHRTLRRIVQVFEIIVH